MRRECIENEVRNVLINGQVAVVCIKTSIEPEFESVVGSYDFGDEVENAAYLARFESGELLNLIITVTAECCGVTGFDSLGGCHVTSAKLESDVKDLIKNYAMVETAIDSLKSNLLDQAKRLNRFI